MGGSLMKMGSWEGRIGIKFISVCKNKMQTQNYSVRSNVSFLSSLSWLPQK